LSLGFFSSGLRVSGIRYDLSLELAVQEWGFWEYVTNGLWGWQFRVGGFEHITICLWGLQFRVGGFGNTVRFVFGVCTSGLRVSGMRYDLSSGFAVQG